MSLAQQFADQVTAAETDLPGPELLPSRLARACVAVLPVTGAGISIFFSADRRLPLGASNPAAAIAERMQFTVGEGPCISAHASGETIVADEESLQARWPAFADVLLARTPVRGIVSIPLRGALDGMGALDLYVEDAADLRALPLVDTLAVEAVLTDSFSRAMDDEPRREGGPSWLDAPPAGRRARVWQAVGMVVVALELTAPDALALLRSYAFGQDTDLDDVAGALVDRRLSTQELADAVQLRR